MARRHEATSKVWGYAEHAHALATSYDWRHVWRTWTPTDARASVEQQVAERMETGRQGMEQADKALELRDKLERRMGSIPTVYPSIPSHNWVDSLQQCGWVVAYRAVKTAYAASGNPMLYRLLCRAVQDNATRRKGYAAGNRDTLQRRKVRLSYRQYGVLIRAIGDGDPRVNALENTASMKRYMAENTRMDTLTEFADLWQEANLAIWEYLYNQNADLGKYSWLSPWMQWGCVETAIFDNRGENELLRYAYRRVNAAIYRNKQIAAEIRRYRRLLVTDDGQERLVRQTQFDQRLDAVLDSVALEEICQYLEKHLSRKINDKNKKRAITAFVMKYQGYHVNDILERIDSSDTKDYHRAITRAKDCLTSAAAHDFLRDIVHRVTA